MHSRLHPAPQHFSTLALVLAGLGALSAGCGDDSGTGSGGGSTGQGGGSTTGTDATTGTGDGGATASTTTGTDTTTGSGAGDACDYPDPNPSPAAPQAITEVQGTVFTTDGDPVADREVQVCGKDICLYGEADANGDVTVTNTGTDLDTPLFKAGDGLGLAKIGFHIPEGASVVVDAVVPPLADSGTALAAGASAEADGVTLTVDAAGIVKLNLLDFSDPGEDTFRAAVVPEAQIDAVAPGEGFDMVVGLGPHDTRFCPSAALSIPNQPGLPVGTAVEIFLLGLDVGEYFADYGTWGKIADGVVSEDGETIVTAEGQGLPVLSSVGIRAVP